MHVDDHLYMVSEEYKYINNMCVNNLNIWMIQLTPFYIQILDPSKEAVKAGCETIIFHATDSDLLNYQVV